MSVDTNRWADLCKALLCVRSAKKGTVRAKSKIHGRDIWLTS